jgi:hypothetical protein
MEFSDPLAAEPHRAKAQQHVHRLVSQDRRQTAPGRAFGRFSYPPTIGSPSRGGYGVLPIREHIQSRHAKWGIALALQLSSPWRALGNLAIEVFGYKRLSTLALFYWPYPIDSTPDPLQRMVAGLKALPPPSINPDLMPHNSLAFYAPLWCNPYLNLPERLHETGDILFWSPLGPLLPTLGSFVLLCGFAGVFGERWNHRERRFSPFNAPLEDMHDRLAELGLGLPHHGLHDRMVAPRVLISAVWEALPFRWRVAAKAAVEGTLITGRLPPGSREESLETIIRSLHYISPFSRKKKEIPLSQFTVRLGTALQLESGPHRQQIRTTYWTPFLSIALDRPPRPTELDQLQYLFRDLWRLPIDNQDREIFWHLVYNGIPCAARLHHPEEKCTACGQQVQPHGPDRTHHFWNCPALDLVKADVQQRLPPPCPLSKSSIWFPTSSPHPKILPLVWQVVALCFLSAADKARASSYRFSLEHPETPQAALLRRTQHLTRYRFWANLLDFQKFAKLPPKWLASLPSDHPFLYRHARQGSLAVERITP